MVEQFIERPHKNEKDEAIQYVKNLLTQAREDNRSEDIEKLEEVIRLLHTKKYGLVWEEHAEIVEEEMKTRILVFIEDETKKIVGNPESEDYNFLLEGDNLHSLHLLKKTHAGKIDVIYIDPPYNTGNKDFIYNDKIVDKTDGYSHSKWLSFMSHRLKIAKDLLSQKGVILVSIDENEQSQLKLLMDEVFGEQNFVESIVWDKKSSAKGVPPRNMMVGVHEYILAYQLSDNFRFLGEKRDESGFKNPDNDPRGPWRESNIKSTTKPIEEAFTITDPNTGKKYTNTWAFSKESLEKMIAEDRILWKANLPKQKEFLNNMRNSTKALKSNWGVFDNQKTTMFLKKLLPKVQFNNPKPLELMKYLIEVTAPENSTILDFFAGSGTTAQAVIEAGGNRKFILATNNENNIAQDITYARLNKLHEGTEFYESQKFNLKYFKTDFVVKEDFPDVTLEYELLNYVTPLVELEFGIDISNPSVQIIITEDQFKDLIQTGNLVKDSTIYLHPNVFLDAKEKQLLNDMGISTREIPDYFFGKDLWS
ncbi:site-specific DNA-methyltransferase [Enterococcus cecorum]|uniref:site-specific DNA-methyltransferase n=1 Tax=Enterococcus cecorum TaxID=44008 RepID=UPI00148D802A|nr:site-specific DNA-methyltransferase [Enterococcus cecorum]